jgi:hypothetical protein
MNVNESKVIIIGEGSNIPGAILIEEYSYEIASPRTKNLSDNPVTFEAGSTVYFNTTLNFENIYHFVFACRVPANINAYFSIGNYLTKEKLISSSFQPYCLTSGGKLPRGMPQSDKEIIFKYLIRGLHVLDLLDRRNLNDTKCVVGMNGILLVSTGNHSFQRTDSWAINMSNLFTGMVIDHYKISPEIKGLNSQRAFVEDPQYRKIVYDMIKEIFVNFIHTNNENISVNRVMPVDEIVKNCLEILVNFLNVC